MTNIQAALGVAQFEQIDKFIDKKRQIGATYNKLLKGINSINLPIHKTSYCENIYWVYAITLKDDFEKNASQIIKELSSFGIGARPFFYPMSQMPMYKTNTPESVNYIFEKGINLPTFNEITREQVRYICNSLKSVL